MADSITPPDKGEIVSDSKELHNTINTALKQEAGGAPVHVFNPDAPAEQKKAEVLGKSNIASIPTITTTPVNTLSTDIGSSNNEKVAEALANSSAPSAPTSPTSAIASSPIAVSQALDKKDDVKSKSDTTAKETTVPAVKTADTPGAYVDTPAKTIPDWYHVGWTGSSSLPNPGDEKAMAEFSKTHTPEEIKEIYNGNSRKSNGEYANDLIAQFVNEKYFGEWYYNCGSVFVCIFFTWLLTRFRFGVYSCFAVGAFFATYYRTSIKRTRRNARDDIQREVSLSRLDSDEETMGWFNLLMDRFWLIYEPILSAQVIGQVDAILAENTPSFLDSIRMSSFTLGTKAPSVDGIRSYSKTSPDEICMDWKFSFSPNDILDMTKREVESKVNPKIVLTIRIGKGMVGAGMPVLLEDLAFKGNLRIKLKLFNEMPFVKTAQISFLEKPHFDYVLKPVGGDTFGFDINNIPGLQTFIKDQVDSNLGPMMYAPNVFTLDVAAMMSGANDLESANGVLAITIYSANELKPSDMFGSLDPYCSFHISNAHNPELARTTAIEKTSNPKWNETHFVLLNNLNDVLCFRVMDRNTGRNDAEVGVANLELKDVDENQNAIEGLDLIVLRSGKPVGEIKADVRYFPVSKPEDKEDGTVIPALDSDSGALRFYIQECKDISAAAVKKKGGVPLVGGLPIVGGIPLIGSGSGDIDSYAILKVNGQEKLKTATFKRSVNPHWNKFVEVFVSDKANLNLEVIIKNSTDFGEDAILGRWTSTFKEMQDQIDGGNDWWNLKEGTGKIHLSMAWKSIPMTGFSAGLTRGSYRHPIGVVRVKLNSAKNLKNVEALTGGKSDPYVRVMSGLQSRGQTEAILDNLDPEWDEAIYAPIHSLREDLLLEVMDWNDIKSDKFLGMTDLFIKDLVVEKKIDDDQSVFEALPAVSRTAELMSKERGSGRGQLNYEASFFPTLALAKQATKEENEAKEATEAKEAGETKDKTEEDSKEKKVVELDEKLESHVPILGESETPEKDLHGEPIHYTPDKKIDLLSYQSGVLSVKIHDVVLPSKVKAFVEMSVDSNDAQFKTSTVKDSTLEFQEYGDAFVKEMEFSRLMVRVRNHKDDNNGDNIGFWTSTVRDIVKAIQERDASEDGDTDDIQTFKLLGAPGGGTIRLSFKFVPLIQFTLDPSESLENQGNLTVTAISASGLKAADKSGTSDPYCTFSVDDQKVYKTKTYKKKLKPVFKDEIFTVPILRRTKAKFSVKIFDWDQIGNNELLAEGLIPIADLESFVVKEVDVPLRGGNILLRLKWEPQLLARKREGTSLIGSTARILTGAPGMGLASGVVGMGVGAGGKAISGGTKVVGGVVGGGFGAIGALGRGIGKIGGHGRKSSEANTIPPIMEATGSPMDSTGAATSNGYTANNEYRPLTPQHSGDKNKSTSIEGAQSAFSDKEKNATIRVTLIGARGLKGMNRDKTSDPYCRVRLEKRSIHKTKFIKKNCDPEWNETFDTKVFATSVLELIVRDHKTLADVDIGEATFHVSEYVDEGRPFSGWLALSPPGNGEIYIEVSIAPS